MHGARVKSSVVRLIDGQARTQARHAEKASMRMRKVTRDKSPFSFLVRGISNQGQVLSTCVGAALRFILTARDMESTPMESKRTSIFFYET